MKHFEAFTLPNIPLIHPGDDLAVIIAESLQQNALTLQDNDIIVLAQKIVSKAEGCLVDLTEIVPSDQAYELAKLTHKPPELVEVILQDSDEIIRAKPGLLIVAHKIGCISANAGLDHSNVSDNPNIVLRLPTNPDKSARTIRQKLSTLIGVKPPLLIIDSQGRPWRLGTVGVVIGLSGLAPVQDWRGLPDLFNRPLEQTDVGFTDQIAATATLLMGQADEAEPVVIIRGLPFTPDESVTARQVLRPKTMDLFR